MSTSLIVVIVIVVVLVVVGAIVLPGQVRSRRLRGRFGPEYDRTVADTDDRRAAETELAQREQRHSTLELRELSDADRAEYLGRWTAIQERFVDEPGTSVVAADRLVTEVMDRMGYPTEDFDQQASDLSVRYASDIERYREAHALAADTAAAGTDGLRRAVLDYRGLVKSLLGAEGEPAVTPNSESATA